MEKREKGAVFSSSEDSQNDSASDWELDDREVCRSLQPGRTINNARQIGTMDFRRIIVQFDLLVGALALMEKASFKREMIPFKW